jgi:hypothetical protein
LDELMDEPTVEELLTTLRTAINARLAGGMIQSYSINGRNIQYLPLAELLALEKSLVLRAGLSQGGARNYVGFGARPT